MKMSMLRKHYYSTDNGKTWLPKRAFNSKQEAIDAGFPDSKWLKYACDQCPYIHVGKNRENNDQ